MQDTRKDRLNISSVLFIAVMLTLPATGAFAATKAAKATTNKTGSGLSQSLADTIANFQQSLPDIFHELSAEDVGVKPRLKPHFAATSSFTSDANLGNEQADPAWLARVSSGLRLELPVGNRLYTELDYTFSFATIQGRQTSENTVTHNTSVLARYDLTDRTILGVSNNFQISEVPGQGGDLFQMETAKAEVTHKFSDILRGNLDYTFQFFNDRSSEAPSFKNQSFWDNSFGTSLDYEVTDRITLIPSFRWSIRDFDQIEGKDYWQISTQLGASYELGPQTILRGHVGWNRREFDFGSDQVDHSIIWGVGLTQNISRTVVWSAEYNHSVADTFDTGFLNRETAEATTLDNLDRNFRLLTIDRINTDIKYYLNEKSSVRTFGAFQWVSADAENNALRTVSNDETAMEIGVGYQYRLNRYISLDVNYVFGRRFSTDDTGSGRNNYTYHKAGGGLSIQI